MSRTPRRRSADAENSRQGRLATRRRFRNLAPFFEALEDRVVLAPVYWMGPNVGDWDTASNWSTNTVPTSADDVTINLASGGLVTHTTTAADSVHSLTTNNFGSLSIGSGSITLGIGNSTVGAAIEVKSGASLGVSDGARVFIQSGQTIAVDAGARMSVGAASVVINANNGGSYGLSVAGSLDADGASFTTVSGYYDGDVVSVASGGRITASDTNFAWHNLVLNSTSTDTLGSNIFYGSVTINSGAAINIHGNDYSNVGAHGIVAVGDPGATIDLTSNFWGTTNSAQIQAKILDHFSDANRPTVNYGTYLGSSPGSITGTVFNDVNGDGVQNDAEVGLAGVLVYLDVNNTGSFVSTDPSTVTNTLGQYAFYGLTSASYIVRELSPLGSMETAPSASAATNTIAFDGTGGEAGITGAGVSSFTYQGASFSGGTIFAASQTALLASGALAYNTSSNPSEVDFSQPVTQATFFYVSGFGYGSGTATAYSATGAMLGTVSSKPATTFGDPANFVTLSFSQPIARITFLGGVVDSFTFTTAANNQANLVRLAAGQTAGGITFGDQYVPRALEVQSFTPTSTGFTARFAAPINAGVLNLYDASGVYGAADATLVRASTGPVIGSLVVSPDGQTVTFIRTAGLLAPDTYTVTLFSGSNAFESTTGMLLDGAGNGVPGSNLVRTFAVSPPASNEVVVSIPDFTRGYGQAVNVPASSTSGLPIAISTGLGVLSVDLTIHYNPALLTLSGFTTSIPGAVAFFNVTAPGTAVITISSPTQFSASAGPLTLGNLVATVPDTAPYGEKEILAISDLRVFDDSAMSQLLPSIGQDAIHVAAFYGDVSGNGIYTTQDITLEQKVIGLANSGFGFFKMTDPVLLGDVTGNGAIQANDTSLIQRVIGQISVPSIPALPTGVAPPASNGPDPRLFIPNVSGQDGQTITVPVEITVTESGGITVSSFQVAISYDPTKFSVSSTAQIGAVFAALGSPVVFFPAPGEIIIEGSSPSGTGLIADGTTADLFDLFFTVISGAADGTSVINLLQNIQSTSTAIFANDADLTQLTLTPAPTNAATDPVDGTFAIGTQASPTSITAPAVSATYNSATQDVTLDATVTSSAGVVNEGTVTFTIFDGGNPVGSPIQVAVSNGSASTPYPLSAGLPGGTYTIQAIYDGTANFSGSTDSSHLLTISAAAISSATVTCPRQWYRTLS